MILIELYKKMMVLGLILLNDVAYHSDKIDRKFNKLINILGADHTGYIKRISAAVSALSNFQVKLIVKFVN